MSLREQFDTLPKPAQIGVALAVSGIAVGAVCGISNALPSLHVNAPYNSPYDTPSGERIPSTPEHCDDSLSAVHTLGKDVYSLTLTGNGHCASLFVLPDIEHGVPSLTMATIDGGPDSRVDLHDSNFRVCGVPDPALPHVVLRLSVTGGIAQGDMLATRDLAAALPSCDSLGIPDEGSITVDPHLTGPFSPDGSQIA